MPEAAAPTIADLLVHATFAREAPALSQTKDRANQRPVRAFHASWDGPPAP